MNTELESAKFTVFYHGSPNGKMRRGYHCPTCGMFYVEGNYSIESATKILGRSMRVFCCDDRGLSVPHLFEEEHEVQQFLNSINITIEGVGATLIPKTPLISALFNPTAIAEYKKKNFN